MVHGTALSLTCSPGQTASSSSSLRTTRSWFSSKYRMASKTFGATGISSPDRRSLYVLPSSSKSPKQNLTPPTLRPRFSAGKSCAQGAHISDSSLHLAARFIAQSNNQHLHRSPGASKQVHRSACIAAYVGERVEVGKPLGVREKWMNSWGPRRLFSPHLRGRRS